MMKRKRIFAIATPGTAVVAGTVFLYLQKMPIPPKFFPVSYDGAPSKSAYLQDYRNKIWNHGGGYIPLPVQHFLCSRLEKSTSEMEVQAIADFYASQAMGRENGPLDKISDAARIRLIDALFHRLPREPPIARLRSLYLIEEVRRGEMIGKGYFYTSNYPRFAAHLRVHPHRKEHEAEEVFQEVLLKWWNSKVSSQEKLRQNPLKEVGMTIDGY